MSKHCGNCCNLVTGNHGAYFLCVGSSVLRKIVKRKYKGKTYYGLYCSFSYRECPIELEMDEEGKPLKCKQCLADEARLGVNNLEEENKHE